MLGNSIFTVIGVGSGMALALKNRGTGKSVWRPFIIATSFGALGDITYGYTGNCRKLIDEFELAKKTFIESKGN